MASISSAAVVKSVPSAYCAKVEAISSKSAQHCLSFPASISGRNASGSGIASSKASCFFGSGLLVPSSTATKTLARSHAARGMTVSMSAVIQFIRGTDEQTIPEVRLTRSKDGSSGTATFSFEQPSVFDSSKELGDITGLYMVDEEGVMQTVDVSAKFLNGKPARIEARYVMRSAKDWERFLRFMERYAETNNLGFTKS